MPTQTPPAEQFTLVWPADLREQTAHLAVVDDRSMSAVIRTALREHLARRQAPARPQPNDSVAVRLDARSVFEGRDNGDVTTTMNGDAA